MHKAEEIAEQLIREIRPDDTKAFIKALLAVSLRIYGDARLEEAAKLIFDSHRHLNEQRCQLADEIRALKSGGKG